MLQMDRKSDHILDAALPVFVRYGFRKASMSDIARAAGISRAALYLCFSSKEELFRTGSARAHTRAMADVSKALAGEGTVFSRIELALLVFQRGLIAPFAESADPADLFATNMALAADITLDTRNAFLSALTSSLAAAAEAGELRLGSVDAGPGELAGLILAAMDGIKHDQGIGEELENGTRLLMRLLRAAVGQPGSKPG
jgi:AcrR family transcriptional regulator